MRLPKLLFLSVLAICLMLSSWVVHLAIDDRRLPREVRSEMQGFEAGPSFGFVGSSVEGTTFCIISCDEYRAIKVWSAQTSRGEACRALSRQLAQRYGEVQLRDPSDPCSASVGMPDVSVDAYAALGAIDLDDEGIGYEFLDGMSFDETSQVAVWISFSSGVD